MVHPSPRVDPENSLYPTSLADNKLPIIPEETIEEMMDVLASDVEMPPKKSFWKRLKTIFRWRKNATVKAVRRRETGRRRMGDQQPEETPHQTLSLRPTETAAESAVGEPLGESRTQSGRGFPGPIPQPRRP
ncbi:hypothetical protein DPEC_G00112640 [Dallia pectoralis]|uniref:Uncharacterized protein n=1 Tax=Dallia pectoralis TaxID=75939 RepID=A0ACC2GTJ1_DALPE|nr:hypothetical protein DPEC_G00112640 [Dallia pectoralis]